VFILNTKMGRFEKLPFCDFKTNKLKDIFTTFGMSCFNYMNLRRFSGRLYKGRIRFAMSYRLQ
jgi:hypothetical protein